MDAITCIKERRSVRYYQERAIEHQVWEKIVEAARYAPSWKNTQIVRYIVVENPELKNRIAEECVLGFVHNTGIIKRCAAVVMVVYSENVCGCEPDGSYTTVKGSHWESFDCGIASQTFCLAAQAYGVGSVILGIFDEDAIRKHVTIPQGQKIAALIACGYPGKECSAAPPRRGVEELLNYL